MHKLAPGPKNGPVTISFAAFKVTKVRKPCENSFGKVKGKAEESLGESRPHKNKQKFN